MPANRGSTGRAEHGLAAALWAVSGVTLLSRLGGLARDVLLVHLFGATAVGSAFATAFAIPNLFRRLFGEGALAAAFIPAYARARAAGQDEAGRLASLTLLALGAVTGGVTVVLELGLLAALWALPTDPQRDLSLRLIMVMLPFMPLICIAATLAGVLQVHGRFGPASSGPLLLNGLIIIVGAYHLATGRAGDARVAYALGGATVLSGLTQTAYFLWLLRGRLGLTRRVGPAAPAARTMLRRFVPVMVGLGTLQLNALLDQVIAMWPIWVGPTVLGRAYPLDEASAAIIAFTQRLYQFPLGVFGIAVATAVFPLLARHQDEPASFAGVLRRGVRLSLFIGLPASAGLWLVRDDLTAVLFSSRSSGFDAQGLARSAAVLGGYAPAVWAYSLNHVLARAFYARGDTLTPTRVALGAMVLNLALNLVLIWPLREAGMAWATSLAATAQCAVLIGMARRRLGVRALDREGARGVARVVLAVAGMSVAVGLVVWAVPASSWGWRAARLAGGVGAGGLAYLALAWACRLPELGWLLAGKPRAAPAPAETP
ncbi:MAG TPA: murein biosynthesis integral membrane protein MurJ [Phycisphaerales bacterium]|nr:murein biosynthesis integral membrane protein MurJ [Phycisphaerales bacterium]